MSRSDFDARVGRLAETNADADYLQLTPEERIAMVWPLTVQAWSVMLAARGEHFDAESRLQRDLVDIQRRGR